MSLLFQFLEATFIPGLVAPSPMFQVSSVASAFLFVTLAFSSAPLSDV